MKVLCTFGPPAERQRCWILKFEDTDCRGDMYFDNEEEAIRVFDRCKDAWTCTLFGTWEMDNAKEYGAAAASQQETE